MMGIIGSIVSMAEDTTVDVKQNSVLHIKLNKPITDKGSDNPFENFNFQKMKPEPRLGLKDILANIEKAKIDDRIKGVFLDVSFLQTGISTIGEIREALKTFKESGKFIIAYSDFYTQGAYYLASVADKIYINPEGGMFFKGISGEMMFLKELLDEFDIQTQVFKGRDNIYKSAAEQYSESKMSEENKEQLNALLNDLWNDILGDISEARSVPVDSLNYFADNLLVFTPESALKNKVIDSLKYRDMVKEELISLADTSQTEKLNLITLTKYNKVPKIRPEGVKGLARDKVAVIFASGTIQAGNSELDIIGADDMVKSIKKAREDKNIKAVVLRVNSPGGSALASEIILRELKLTQKTKPLIVSMGDVAASGGYYISACADTIVANANTITGSIGVIGLIPNIKGLLDEHLLIHIDRVKTNDYADFISVTRPMSDVEKGVFNISINKVYDTFIHHIAEGRNMTKDQVEEIAKGRVWSGIDAKEKGLVDVLGGLEDAINIAVEVSNLDRYRIKVFPEEKDPFQQIMEDFMQEAEVRILKEKLGPSYKYYRHLDQLSRHRGVQAILPYSLDINF